MFSELIPSSTLFDELVGRPENLKLKYSFKKMIFSDVWKLFSFVFLKLSNTFQTSRKLNL